MNIAYWSGKNGDDYIARQQESELLAAYTAMWGRILACTDGVKSVIEFGASVGLNLDAIRALNPKARLMAVEPNAEAVKVLVAKGYGVEKCSLQDWNPRACSDLAFTRGVLIHITPEYLPSAYAKLYHASDRYIVLAEYYSPKPVEIEYRGQKGLLWKRDFAGEMLERYEHLRLIDYGFVYRRDPVHPQDDVSWFLLRKER